MMEPTQRHFEDKLARFARGELSPAEERELAQESLESPAWFEELTATALAKTAVRSIPAPAEPVRSAWWRSPFLFVAAAAIVVGVFILPYLSRISQKQSESSQIASSPGPRTGVLLSPTLVFSPGSSQPVLLAEDLQITASSPATKIFRGETETTRAPRQIGSILSIEDGQATIDLGSTDGLAKGSELAVYRDHTLKDPVGSLRIGTVFREQSRGEARGQGLKTQYAVRVSDRAHLEALLEQADDLQARGDLGGARRGATSAVSWVKTAKIPLSDQANAMRVLAGLDYQAGDAGAAETHYRAALALLSADPRASPNDLSALENDLAALAMVRGDYDSAQKLLDGLPSNQNLGADCLNNLGVLAEARGNRQQAESSYSRALEALSQSSSTARKVVEANLARVKGLP
jgi:Flp pilus assembly protein TadD